MATKAFSKKLHEQNDEKARQIAKDFFTKQGFLVQDNPNKYGVDLIAYKDGELKFYIECEIKRVWKEDKFPYGSVQFPERKWKFCNLDRPTAFFMLNNKCNHAVLVTGQDLVKSPLRAVPNIYMQKDENFFQVPLDKATFVEL